MKAPLSEQFVKRADHVVWKVIEGKGILLNLENGSYFETDPVGLAIWQQCNGKTSGFKIAQTISEEFSGDLSRVSKDLAEFVSELKRRKMVEVLDKLETAAVFA